VAATPVTVVDTVAVAAAVAAVPLVERVAMAAPVAAAMREAPAALRRASGI
jgi:hypothetical protein